MKIFPTIYCCFLLIATGQAQKRIDIEVNGLANLNGKYIILSKGQIPTAPGGGGDDEDGPCTSDADCVNGKDMNCNGQIIPSGPGRCYANTGSNEKKCHYSVAC